MPDLGEIAALRLRLWEHGYRPVALFGPDHPDPKIAGKAPIGKNWRQLALQDPPSAAHAKPLLTAPNTGILADGLQALDLDIDDPELCQRVAGLAERMLGPAPYRWRGNSPRRLALYRAAAGQPTKRTLPGKRGKIEILGAGQQFAAFGTHATQAELKWTPGDLSLFPADKLPTITEDQARAFLAAAAPLIEADPPRERPAQNGHDHAPTDLMRLAHDLYELPNAGPADWEAWNSTGLAIWSATQGSDTGFTLWDTWSKRHLSYDAAETKKRWDHFFVSPPDHTGAGRIHAKAAELRRGKPLPAPPTPTPTGPCLPYFVFADGAFAPTAGDFVQDTLLDRAMSVVYGESNTGKTFFATDLGIRVAAGMPWFGKRVRQGAVLYLAMEGTLGIRNRIVAFKEAHDLTDANVSFAVVTTPLNFLDSDTDPDAVIATIKALEVRFEQPIVLTIADTLARAMAGGNENSPEDMGAIVKTGDRIRSETGTHLMFIHHSGKDQAKGMRGHSSLRAATDTEIEVTALDGVRTAEVKKQRELESGQTYSFQLTKVVLGRNQHDDEVTSCVVAPVEDEAPKPKRRLAGHNRTVYECLANLLAQSGAPGFGAPDGVVSVPEEWWRDRFYETAMPGAADDTKKRAFRRAADCVSDMRLVRCEKGRVWLTSMHKHDRQVVEDDNF